MKLLKNKRIISYLSLVIPVLAILLAILGGITHGLVGDTFSSVIILFLILGAIATVAGFLFNNIEYIDIIAIVFYGLALGLIFFGAVEVIAYSLIGIDNNVGGQFSLAITYLVLSAIIFVISVVLAFFDKKTKKQ